MNEITFQGNYNDFKVQMDVEIKEAAAGFVRIGYLLKVARDTNVLEVSGYKSVADFAKAEYGLTKDMVSRYIAINDKYSENGYSDQLLDKYKSYGVAKLAEMLTLPDEIAEQIPPELTKKEIQEIKKDFKDEQAITDIEVMLEDKPQSEYENNLERTLFDYFRQQDMYKELHETYRTIISLYEMNELTADKINQIYNHKDQIIDVIAPNGMANIRARIPGTGRMMLVIDEEKDEITLTNMRSMEKELYSWEDMGEAFKKLSFPFLEYEKAYFELYGEFTVENVEVAPVQQPEEQVITRKNEEEERDVNIETENVSIEPENVSIEAEKEIENKDIVSEEEEYKEIVSDETEVINEKVIDIPTLTREEFEKRWIGHYEIMSESTAAFLRALRNYEDDVAKIHLEEINKVMKEFFKLKILEPEEDEE